MGQLGPAVEVVVVGAGVSGLTTAIRLAEAGIRVRVVTHDPPVSTTSAVAGASWGPYLVTDSRVLAWSRESLSELQRIAHDTPAAGVALVDGLEVGAADFEIPEWARRVPGFRLCPTGDLPAGYAIGWRYQIPLIDMPVYLTYLERRLAAAGVQLEIGEKVASLLDLTRQAPIVVNCTGLAARILVPDDDLSPIRGQLVVVKNPGVHYFFQDNEEGEELTYFLPHGDRVVLGGTLNAPPVGGNAPDPLVRQRIIERCARIEPMFTDPVVIEDRVGLRPARRLVRLEREGAVIHNYGHSGSGVTLSWGCASEVLRLVRAG